MVRESVAHGRRAGTWTALGVGVGIFVHVAYSLLGIGLIVSQSIVLFNALKWLAAAYLFYIGIKALRARPAAAGELEVAVDGQQRSARAPSPPASSPTGSTPRPRCSSSRCSPW